MNALGRNLAANFLGTGWLVLVQLLCVPLYVAAMGVEAWALVGVHLTLTATFLVLDFGMTPTMNRVLARYRAQAGRDDEMRDFARTLEAAYWLLGLVPGGAIALLAPIIATEWVHPKSLPPEQVREALRWMGAVMVVQWPLGLYAGGLQGLELQVRLNAVRAAAATLAGFGAVVVLRVVSPDIVTYFRWQLAVALLQVAVTSRVFWRSMPSSARAPRVAWSLARTELAFAGGVGAITVFGVIAGQMDKLVVSKLVSLEAFGYYTLAATVVGGLQLFIRPVYNAVFPRLSALVASGDEAGVAQTYHQASQLLSALLAPTAAVLAFFSVEAVLVWTGDASTAQRAGPVVAMLVIGTAVNGVMHLPYALQLAHGWTRIGLALSAGQVLLFLPLLAYAAQRDGPVGAAQVWALLNLVYLAVGVPWTHARLLRGHALRWLGTDVALPVAAAVALAAAVRALAPAPQGRAGGLLLLVVAGVASGLAALAASPQARALVSRWRGAAVAVAAPLESGSKDLP